MKKMDITDKFKEIFCEHEKGHGKIRDRLNSLTQKGKDKDMDDIIYDRQRIYRATHDM